ncbi:MAG: GC-type dockerin domain-anchored protein [Phycisphaerales bacterium]
MILRKTLFAWVVGLVLAASALGQQPIDPVGRSASASAFADGEQRVRFEQLYRPFDVDFQVGASPASVSSVDLVSGPTGPLSFEVDAELNVTATTGGVPDGRATSFATENLLIDVDASTPFTLAAVYGRSEISGAAANSGTLRLLVVDEGVIVLSSGERVSEIVLRTSDSATGETAAGRLEPGTYRLRVEFSSNAAAIGGDASANFEASAFFATTCRADVTADGVLDLFDFLDFQILFSQSNPRADFTGDGIFDIFDFLRFISTFQDGC